MYCEKCGANIAESSKFCEKCGAKQSRPEQTPNINMGYKSDNTESSNRFESQSFQLEEVLSTKEYIKMYLLMMVPILNIVLLIKWGFGEGVNTNKRNLAKVMLIFMAISIVPAIIAISVTIPSMMSLYSY